MHGARRSRYRSSRVAAGGTESIRSDTLNEEPKRQRRALWLIIGVIAAVGIIGNVAIALWLLTRTV